MYLAKPTKSDEAYKSQFGNRVRSWRSLDCSEDPNNVVVSFVVDHAVILRDEFQILFTMNSFTSDYLMQALIKTSAAKE